jgi:hypothetical protein
MYNMGDVALGKNIGKNGNYKYILAECSDCKEQRWVLLHKSGNPVSERCATCWIKGLAGESNHMWRGGRISVGKKGYIMLLLQPGSFYFSMADTKNYVYEHRLVMAQHLGRCLHTFESVHHKNGKRADNRIENLELSQKGAHSKMHNKGYQDGYQKGLLDGRNKQIQELKELIENQTKQIRLLQWQTQENKVGGHL